MTDPNPSPRRKRLFVIDDDQTVIDLLVLRLESRYDVGGTTRPAKGVEQASLFGADLVLCDIDMPGMSGDRMARALRSDPRTAAVPIVYLTGMLPAGETSTTLGGSFGSHLAISKTASMDALLKVLEQALATPLV
jgi:CheY-like chemotaxis protein